MRWEEPRHPGRPSLWFTTGRHSNPQRPTSQHNTGRALHTLRRTDLLPGADRSTLWLEQADSRALARSARSGRTPAAASAVARRSGRAAPCGPPGRARPVGRVERRRGGDRLSDRWQDRPQAEPPRVAAATQSRADRAAASGAVSPPPLVAPLDTDDTRGKPPAGARCGNPLTLSLGSIFLIGVSSPDRSQAAPDRRSAPRRCRCTARAADRSSWSLPNAAREDFFTPTPTSRGLNRAARPGVAAADDAAAAQGRPALRRAGDERHAAGRVAGSARPLHLRGRHARQRRRARHRLLPLHGRHARPAGGRRAGLQDVYCQRRSGFRFMDSAEDVFRRMQRLELESEALDKRYEIFYGANDDEIWMKRLFSPSFIVWLTEAGPEGLRLRVLRGQPLRQHEGPLRQRRRARPALHRRRGGRPAPRRRSRGDRPAPVALTPARRGAR